MRSWLKRHRKLIVVVSTTLGAIGLILKVRSSKSNIDELIVDTMPNASANTSDTSTVADVIIHDTQIDDITITIDDGGESKTFLRDSFIRRLHDGWHPSPEKLAQADALGISLNPGETIVNECTVTKK